MGACVATKQSVIKYEASHKNAHLRDGKMSQMRPRSARKAPRKNLQLIIKIIIYMEELT